MTVHCRSLQSRHTLLRGAPAAVAAGLMISACTVGAGLPTPAGKQHQEPPAGHPAAPRTAEPTTVAPASAAQSSAPASSAPPGTPGRPLAGMIVGIDPGHNGGNFADPAYIDHQIWNGREWETCDTTGTETDSGYTEAQYNVNVAGYLRADLRRDGAQIVMTRTSDNGVGPCVNRRSEIINHAHANVAIDIHADGAPASGRGFTVLEPVSDGPNDQVISASQRLGRDVRAAFLAGTAMPVSNYDGIDGITSRDDLAGLNLTTVPKILIECGNMKNATDARMLTSRHFQQQVAKALETAIIRFLHS